MKTLSTSAKILLCVVALLIPVKSNAATSSNGNFIVNPAAGENGDLTVDGNLGVNGGVDFVNGFKFGSTLETTPVSAVEFLYGESGTEYSLAVKTRRPNTTFFWQDNALGTLKNKMTLGADNVLTLYKSNGAAGLVLDPNGAGVTFDGQTLLTQNAADSLYLPVSPSCVVGWPSSFAVGVQNCASGEFSTALGSYTSAMGKCSTTTGSNTTANSWASTAMGESTSAVGDCSTAMGYSTVATGYSSTAMGEMTTAGGESAMATGFATYAVGNYSIAMGFSTGAYGMASMAMGVATSAVGDFSTAMGSGANAAGYASVATGRDTNACAYASLALGQSNVGAFAIGGDTHWIETDPVLEIGNGQDWETPSNAVTIFKNGKLRTSNVAEFKGGVRVPQQGDLSMGDFIAGPNPADLDPTLGLKYQNE